MDGARWSETEKAGLWPVLISSNGGTSPMAVEGAPVVKELSATELGISQPLRGGGVFSMVCSEAKLTCAGVGGQGQPLSWAWTVVGGARQKSVVRKVTSKSVAYHVTGMDYQLRLPPDGGSCRQLENGILRLDPNPSGKLVLLLDVRGELER
jgi:hypothetical protein